MTTSIEQINTYKVLYSDGFTVMGYIIASNLPEAIEMAKKRKNEWKTAYYKVVRCYNGGVRG